METYCCRLGRELLDRHNIIYESENFFAVPALGQLGIEGYLLLCSKKHHIGLGDIPKIYYPELENFLDKTRNVIFSVYGSGVLMFEHGPRFSCHKGGGCLDHAHLHLVPTSVDVMDFLNKIFKPQKINGLDRLKKIFKKQKSSYLFLIDQSKKRYVIETTIPIPSQYIRQIIASKMGVKDWDWRINPDRKTFIKTIKRLKNKF